LNHSAGGLWGNLTEGKEPQVVIIGGGFGGLWAARTLADQPVNKASCRFDTTSFRL